MMDMWAAIALSTGNKAKARDKHGDIVIVERYHSRIKTEWGVWVINKRQEGSGSGVYEAGAMTDVLLDYHGINPNATCWLPVEAPFSDEGLKQPRKTNQPLEGAKKYRFRTKPDLIICVVQFNPQKQPWPKGINSWPDDKGLQPRDMSWGYINTLSGREHVMTGDYIASIGETGEIYPIRADFFEKHYEPVEDMQ